MKTLAVLAALTAVAAAVPALPGHNYGYKPVHYRLPAHYRREKKSPQVVSDLAPADIAIDPSVDPASEDFARTIGLKKPIIVKKKFGYHLYRDSAEEQANADPQERCNKEVKVKLCDAEHLRSGDMMRAAEDTEAKFTDSDVKNSIQQAKEAVENLQKMAQFKNAHLGPEAEVHEDIEVARQALEHIQKNFGNLEEMNLQATTLTDGEALHGARFAITKNENERLSQWKEAIQNIQKNAEIARNIEDSFKSSDMVESTHITDMESKLEVTAKSTNEEKVDGARANVNSLPLETLVPAASELRESKTSIDVLPAAKEAEILLSTKRTDSADWKGLDKIEQSRASKNMESLALTSVLLKKEHTAENQMSSDMIRGAWKENGEINTLAKSNDNSEHLQEAMAFTTPPPFKKSAEPVKDSEDVNKKIEVKDASELPSNLPFKSAEQKEDLKMIELTDGKNINQVEKHEEKSAAEDKIPVESSLKSVEHEIDTKPLNLKSSENEKLSADFPSLKSAEHKGDNTDMISASTNEKPTVAFTSFKSAENNAKDIKVLVKSANFESSKEEKLSPELSSTSPLKSAELKMEERDDMAIAATNEIMTADLPTFTPFKSSEHKVEMKSTSLENMPVYVETKSAVTNEKQAVDFPPFTPFKSVDHKIDDVDMKTVASNEKMTADFSPFTPFKSAEHKIEMELQSLETKPIETDMKSAATVEKIADIPRFTPFKSAEHKESETSQSVDLESSMNLQMNEKKDTELKSAILETTEAKLKSVSTNEKLDSELTPFTPLKSAENKAVETISKSANFESPKDTKVSAEFTNFTPFKSVEHKVQELDMTSAATNEKAAVEILPFKSAELKMENIEMKHSALENMPVEAVMKSASAEPSIEANEMNVESSNNQKMFAELPPFTPFRSVNHNVDDIVVTSLTNGKIAEVPPFESKKHEMENTQTKSAELRNIPTVVDLDSTSSTEKKVVDLSSFPLFKSVEHKMEDSEMKAAIWDGTNGESPLKSGNAKIQPEKMTWEPVNGVEKAKSVQNVQITDFKSLPFISADQQVMKAAEELKEPSFQGKTWHKDDLIQKSSHMEGRAPSFSPFAHQFGSPAFGGTHMVGPTIHGPHLVSHVGGMGIPAGVPMQMGLGFKAAEADNNVQATSQTEGIQEKAALDHSNKLQLKEAGRGAYGGYGAGAAAAAASASGPGAVGVFPGAKVGGCAIPLLLSCAPSVVPGTLASGHSYSAPHGYRSTNNLSGRFQMKRDLKKTNPMWAQKVKRTTGKVIQRIPMDKRF